MRNVRVLVVDDEQDFREMLSRHLEDKCLQVLTADSGENALDVLLKSPVDVVILDVKMPGLSGIETLRWIKKDHPEVEVIMLTGYASLEASTEGMEFGAFDYLLKPVDTDILTYKIQDAAKKKILRDP
ncbi:MAG: response regulator [Deltaproteobacteria bacterium]|nr:response regulator [Deltaproteobacteria bacterium]